MIIYEICYREKKDKCLLYKDDIMINKYREK